MRKYGCGSVPVLALHCQPPLLEARSPSMNCCMKCCGCGEGLICSQSEIMMRLSITYSLAKTPVNHKVLRQIHCGNHAHAIVHPAWSSGILSQTSLRWILSDNTPIVLP